MIDAQVSLTAMLTAFARAYHTTHDEPKIFDDFLAAEFLTADEQAYMGQNLAKALAFFEPESLAACLPGRGVGAGARDANPVTVRDHEPIAVYRGCP